MSRVPEPGFDPDQTLFFFMSNPNQKLLTELGEVYSLIAYLEYHGIAYMTDQRSNADAMSPNSEAPFILWRDECVAGIQNIFAFLERTFVKKEADSAPQIMPNNVDLFEKAVLSAELVYTWCDSRIYDNFTVSRFGFGKPWPINLFLCWLKKWDVSSVSWSFD